MGRGRLPVDYGPPCRDLPTLHRAWCARQRASHSQIERILQLLDSAHLFNLPLPPRTCRLFGTPNWKWGRFLFRRHIQRILF
jgi:hypothetical protein